MLQSSDRFKSMDSLKKNVDKKTGRLQGFLDLIGVPCMV